jgi:hypothetical protein
MQKIYYLQLVNKSREIRDIFKGKHGKCMSVSQGKLYIGCTDSSIQVSFVVLFSTYIIAYSKNYKHDMMLYFRSIPRHTIGK